MYHSLDLSSCSSTVINHNSTGFILKLFIVRNFILVKNLNLNVILTTALQRELILVLKRNTLPSLPASPSASCTGYPSLAAPSPPSSAQTRQPTLVDLCLGIHTWMPTFYNPQFIPNSCSAHDLGTQ